MRIERFFWIVNMRINFMLVSRNRKLELWETFTKKVFFWRIFLTVIPQKNSKSWERIHVSTAAALYLQSNEFNYIYNQARTSDTNCNKKRQINIQETFIFLLYVVFQLAVPSWEDVYLASNASWQEKPDSWAVF
jgi:hypothetical protein